MLKLFRSKFLINNLRSNRSSIKRIITNSSAQYSQSAKLNDNQNEAQPTTHFGFETVKTTEKAEKVHKVFEDVANSYDVMNDAMSMGIHRIWKDIFIERLGPTNGTKLLDMAGGTGDIAFRYIKYLNNLRGNDRADDLSDSNKMGHVTISDINQNMLDVGIKRAERLGLNTNPACSIDWICANAENLPFADNSFNCYTIAYGIRNCTHIDRVLSEAYRVLQPGGRFMCLEFSHLNNATLQWLYDQYSFTMIPPMGQVLAGQWEAYQYLVESIRRFPTQEEFKSMIEGAHFRCVNYENLTFGVCSIHSGFKL